MEIQSIRLQLDMLQYNEYFFRIFWYFFRIFWYFFRIFGYFSFNLQNIIIICQNYQILNVLYVFGSTLLCTAFKS